MNILDFLKAAWDTFTLPKKVPFQDMEIPTNDFPNVNTGIAPGQQQRDEDYHQLAAGASPIKYEVVLPNGDWRDFVPNGEKQSFQNFDSMSCVSYSNNNSAEIQLKQATGLDFNFSDRALSVLGKTTPQGAFLSVVADVGRNIGRILESDYPDDGATSWDDFEKPLSDDILKKAFRFNEAYQWIPTDLDSLRYYLKQSPIQIIINYNTHAVCLVYADESGFYYFDSYPPYLKKTTVQPNYALQIIVKPITQFVKKKGTGEYGFYAGGVDLADLANIGARLGYPIIKPDGTAPWDKAKEIIIN